MTSTTIALLGRYALLIERLMLYARNLGLRGQDSGANPLMVSDREMTAIFGGLRKIARTGPRLGGERARPRLGLRGGAAAGHALDGRAGEVVHVV